MTIPTKNEDLLEHIKTEAASKPFGLTFFEKVKEEAVEQMSPNSVITGVAPTTGTHRPNGSDTDIGGGIDF